MFYQIYATGAKQMFALRSQLLQAESLASCTKGVNYFLLIDQIAALLCFQNIAKLIVLSEAIFRYLKPWSKKHVVCGML